jgi:fructokinase
MTAPLVAAVELGGTKINLAVGTGPGDLRSQTVVPTTDATTTMRAVIDFLRAQSGVLAIGIASFGPACLDTASPAWGNITTTTKPGWSDTPVARAIGEATGLPIAFDTDVNGAALGEYRWGVLGGCGVGLYLTVGTGVGGGVVIDGVPLHGRRHPEMGHIRLKRVAGDDFAGVCPFHGDCLEGLVSGPAVIARLGHSLSHTEPGDAGRALVIDALGQGLASLVLTLSPHCIVIGGGVAKTPGFHAEVAARLKHWLGEYVAVPEGFVVPPKLGDNAGIAGAIALAQDLLERPGKGDMNHV